MTQKDTDETDGSRPKQAPPASPPIAPDLTLHEGGGEAALQDLRDLFTNNKALLERERQKANRLKRVK